VSDTELLPKSKPEPVRRLELFTGTGRRRAWSAEQKGQIIAESYQSGETRRRREIMTLETLIPLKALHSAFVGPDDTRFNASFSLTGVAVSGPITGARRGVVSATDN
jgi:hypothetical protein